MPTLVALVKLFVDSTNKCRSWPLCDWSIFLPCHSAAHLSLPFQLFKTLFQQYEFKKIFSDGEVQFEKLQFSFNSLGNLSQTHKAVFNNDHLFLFGEHVDYDSTYDQHRNSILSGTYVMDIDLNTLAARKVLFPHLESTIFMEEKIFVYKNDIFMITYNTNWYFRYRFLYKWLNDSWVPMKFKTADIQFRMLFRYVEIHITLSDSDTVIFTTSLLGENMVIFSKFTENDEDVGYMLTRFYTTDELPLPSSHVLFTGIKGEKLSSIMEMKYGTYHWVPDTVIEVNPNNETFVEINIQGDVPNWAFSGPRYVFQSKDKLLLAGGTELIGIDQHKQSRDIWILNLSSYTYAQLPVQLPEEAMSYKMCAALDVEKSIYYVIDVDAGIYRVNLTRWLE
ncbi:nonstructural protein [Trichinella pseudospiralis]